MAEWPSHSQVNKFRFSLFSYEKHKQSQILSLKPQISFKANSRLIKFTSSHKFFQPQVQKWIPISKKLFTSTGLIKLIIKKVFHAIFIYPSISCQLSTPGSQVLVEPNQAVIGSGQVASRSQASPTSSLISKTSPQTFAMSLHTLQLVHLFKYPSF